MSGENRLIMITQAQRKRHHYLMRKLRFGRIIGTAGGGCLGISLLAFLSQKVSCLIPPFGATCVIAFVIPDSAYAKPRSILGGHFLSSLIGIACFHFWGGTWWSYGLAVGLAMLVMQLTRTLHPPAAADPILLIEQGQGEWSFLLQPVLVGALFLVIFAALYNRLVLPKHSRSAKRQVFLTNGGNESKINKV